MPGCAAPKSSMRPQARSVCRIGIPMREASRRSTFEPQTPIVVTDTDSSPRFYRDLLGLHVAGTSENYCTEQEHLNNVFGAHLRITSLHRVLESSSSSISHRGPAAPPRRTRQRM